MRAFQGLLAKDFSISRNWFITAVAGNLILLLLAFTASVFTGIPLSFLSVVVIVLLGFHALFLPVTLLQILSLEGKTQIWLYNPQNSKKLFLSKIIVCFIYQCISQMILTMIGLILFLAFGADIPLETTLVLKGTIVFNIVLLSTGLYLSCWVLFYWSIYHSLAKYPGIKGIRWIILILIFTGYNTVTGLLANLRLFREIAGSWTIQANLEGAFSYEQGTWSGGFTPVELPVLPIIVYTMMAIALYLFSSWLLDRKVEV